MRDFTHGRRKWRYIFIRGNINYSRLQTLLRVAYIFPRAPSSLEIVPVICGGAEQTRANFSFLKCNVGQYCPTEMENSLVGQVICRNYGFSFRSFPPRTFFLADAAAAPPRPHATRVKESNETAPITDLSKNNKKFSVCPPAGRTCLDIRESSSTSRT